MSRRQFILALFALAASAAGALEPDQVLITYGLKVGAQNVYGVSRQLEWSFVALDAQRALVRVSVPIDSFDSARPELESVLRNAVDSTHHPFAQLEGIAQHGRLEGTLELGGVVRPVTMQVQVRRIGGNVVAAGSFAFDLREYGVSIPEVDPQVSVEVSVRLSASADAVVGGGIHRPEG